MNDEIARLQGQGYTRRQVIGQLAWTAAGTAMRPLAPLVASGRSPKRVILVGAGLAGLCAAYELAALGHDVSILEAQERPGGRVQTLRTPFTGDLHAEAGASRIPTSHDLTLGYARRFGYPWVLGAVAYLLPGQVSSIEPHIARPEGRIHFAGEHASSLRGWMQGALESGRRVASEIDAA